MKNLDVDIAVIGGGPAGLAASLEAKRCSDGKVIILERNRWLGGILPQCIHDGFGVEETGESLTGPEYAERYIKQVKDQGIQWLTETMVCRLNKKHGIFCVNKEGLYKISAKAIILSTGCREKTRWDAMIPGSRPSGVFTAGTAQGLINLYNIMPGKKIVILGSGDVGLIMARRFTLEGAKVLGVAEILSYPTGIPRNVVQCLDDFDIPLLLNHTVTQIEGNGRIENVILAKVDKTFKPLKGSEKKINCDTLLLSLGLIPENELARKLDIQIDNFTGGPYITQYFETSTHGIFSVGNSLQVYDTVDMLCSDAKKVGGFAAAFMAQEKWDHKSKDKGSNVRVIPGKGVKHLTPQYITDGRKSILTVRAARPLSPATLCISTDDHKRIYTKKLRYVNPANLIQVEIVIPENILYDNSTCEVSIDG